MLLCSLNYFTLTLDARCHKRRKAGPVLLRGNTFDMLTNAKQFLPILVREFQDIRDFRVSNVCLSGENEFETHSF